MQLEELLNDIIKKLIAKGASKADAILSSSEQASLGVRLQEIETLESSIDRGIGIRAFIGNKSAIVSTTDFNKTAIDELVERVILMASHAPEDIYADLAAKEDLASNIDNLQIFDETSVPEDDLIKLCMAAEDEALKVKGISNSEGADASYSKNKIIIANSNDFCKSYNSSMFSLSLSVLAKGKEGMERDYDFSSCRHFKDLKTPKEIGKTAANLALRRIDPVRVKTCNVPVIFAPRVARGLVGYVASAVNGASIVKGTSFLKDKMQQKIFSSGINIINDPKITKGLSSRPFDAEGVATKKMHIVADGNLQNWLLDVRSAKKLGLKTNGNAARGFASAPLPSPSNLYLENGKVSFDDLIGDIKSGFYVTDTFGMGVNILTGDYSQGASGLWIENGKISYPVSEVTIAGNLNEMFQSLTPADDLKFEYATNSPSVRIESMTVAGLSA